MKKILLSALLLASVFSGRAQPTPSGLPWQSNPSSNRALIQNAVGQQVPPNNVLPNADVYMSLTQGFDDYLTYNPAFVEPWSGLTNWTFTNSATVQVSNGALFANGGGNQSQGNHSFVVASGVRASALFNLNFLPTGSGGGVSIGVSQDTAGAAPPNGGTNGLTTYFAYTGIPVSYNLGTGTTLQIQGTAGYYGTGTATAMTAQKYIVKLFVDAANISICAESLDGNGGTGSIAVRNRFSRTGFTLNNIMVGNSFSNALSGSSLGLLAAHLGGATLYAPSPALNGTLEYQGPTEVLSSDGTNTFKVSLPSLYDSRHRYPLIIAVHASGGTEAQMTDSAITAPVANAFLQDGYIVATATYTSNDFTWGSQNGLNAYTALYNYVKSNFPVGDVVLWGQSMGGIESLTTLIQGRIPKIKCWIGTSPTTNLGWCYNSGTWTSLINTAYGITGSGSSTYAILTAGYDPVLHANSDFPNIPMLFCYATDDTEVSPVYNTVQLINQLTPYLKTVPRVLTTTQGLGHNSLLTPFAAPAVNFADQYISHHD